VEGFKEALQKSFSEQGELGRDGSPQGINLSCAECEDKACCKSGWCAGQTMVALWTSPVHCRPLDREWCSLLQGGLRLNDEDLSPIIARIWATMNVYCCANRKEDASERIIAWPGPLPDEEHLVFHRGTRLPDLHHKWWDRACEHSQVFRSTSAIPVSKLAAKAMTFMHKFSRPSEAPKAYFRFYLEEQQDRLCDHAVCLDEVSQVPEEQEFLFPPFSSFQAIEKRWVEDKEEEHEGYFVILIRVFKDNMGVSKDVELCPWI